MPETAAFSHSFATLQQLAEDVLKHARDKGASACEVDVSEGFGQSVGVRCDEVETIEFNRDKGVGITIYAGQRKGCQPSWRSRCPGAGLTRPAGGHWLGSDHGWNSGAESGTGCQ